MDTDTTSREHYCGPNDTNLTARALRSWARDGLGGIDRQRVEGMLAQESTDLAAVADWIERAQSFQSSF